MYMDNGMLAVEEEHKAQKVSVAVQKDLRNRCWLYYKY